MEQNINAVVWCSYGRVFSRTVFNVGVWRSCKSSLSRTLAQLYGVVAGMHGAERTATA